MYPDDQPTQPSGPSRGRLVAIFGGLAVLGLLIGIGAAQLTSAGPDDDLAGAITSPSPTTPEAEPVSDRLGLRPADDEPTPTPTATRAPNYRSIPENALSEPGLDFGYLTGVMNQNGTVTLRFDRATFSTDAKAKRHDQGKAPETDYLIENTNPAQRTFELDPKASIIAANRLLNQPDQVTREALTAEEFVRNSAQALGTGVRLPVWLRHTGELTGPVTALAEQYLP
jgi:hypothetical protein